MRGLAKLSLLIATLAVVALISSSVDLHAFLSFDGLSGSYIHAPHSILRFNDVEPTVLSVSLINPLGTGYANNTNVTFEYTVTGPDNITNCTLTTNESGIWVNYETNGTAVANNSNPNYIYHNSSSPLLPRTVYWNVMCYNTSNDVFSSPTNGTFLLTSDGPGGSDVNVTASNLNVGAISDYMLNFTTNSTANLSTINVTFPYNCGIFNVSGAFNGSDPQNVSVTGFQVINQTAMFSVTNATTAGANIYAGTQISLNISNVTNAPSASICDGYWLVLETFDNDSVSLQGPANSTHFFLSSGDGGNFSVHLNSPYNTSFENNSNVTFNFSVRGVNVTGCELWTNESGSWANLASNASTVLSGSADYGDPNFIYSIVNVSSLPSAVVWNVNCSNTSEFAFGDNASILIAQAGTCGSVITSSITLNQSLNCSGGDFALAVVADDVVLDCNGSVIDGNGSTGFGVAVSDVNNVTVKNCTFSRFNQSSAFFLNSNNSLYANNTCAQSRSCIYTANSSSLTFSQSVFDNYSEFGIYAEFNYNFNVSNSNFSNASTAPLKIQNTSFCLVNGNRFSSINYSEGPLVSLESDSNCSFSSNTLQNLASNGGSAVVLFNSASSSISSNTLENLSTNSSNYSASAFAVENPTGPCSVMQNTVRNSSVGISVLAASIPVLIQANNISNAQDTAIWASESVVDIRGNYLENSNNSGVSIQNSVSTASNITNNTINGTSSFYGAGINLWNSSARAWNNSIYTSPTAIRVSDSNGVSTIELNRIYGANDTGIRVYNATAVINENYLQSSNVTGIGLSDCGGHSVNVTYNTVNRTEYWDNGNGINAWVCDGARIDGNSVNNTATGAIAVSNSSNAVVNNNTVWHSAYQAIAVWTESQNTNVTNNFIYTPINTNGIVVEGFSFGTRVSGNYVFNYSSSGIFVRNAYNTTVSNNVVENKSGGSNYSADGLSVESSPNTTVTGLTVLNADTCFRATDSTFLSVYDSNCMQTTMLAHVNGSTNVTVVNTSYNAGNLGSVDNESSSLSVFFYLDLTVLNLAGSPIDGANVTIINFNSGTAFNDLTTASGQIPRQLLSDRFKNNTAETIMTPQNVTAFKTGQGTATALVNLTQTFSVNLTLNLSTLALDVWDQTTAGKYDGGQTKYVNDNVTIYANFTVNGQPVVNSTASNCSLNTENIVNTIMLFNASNSLYYLTDSFTTVGGHPYNVSCNNGTEMAFGANVAVIVPHTEYTLNSTCNWTKKLEVVDTPQGQNNITIDTVTDACNYYGYTGTVYVNVTKHETLGTNITGANYSEYLEVAGLGSVINLTLEISNGFNCSSSSWTLLQNNSQYYAVQNFNWTDGETKCIRSNYSIDPASPPSSKKFNVVNSLNFTPTVYDNNSLTMHTYEVAVGVPSCANHDCGVSYNGTLDDGGPVIMQFDCPQGPGECGDDQFHHQDISLKIAETADYSFDKAGSCAALYIASPGSFTNTNWTVQTGSYLYCFPIIQNGTLQVMTAVKVSSATHAAGCGPACVTAGVATMKMRTEAPMQYIKPDIDPYFDTTLHNVTVQVNSTAGLAVGTGQANVSAFYLGGQYGPFTTNSSGQALVENIPSNGYNFVAYGTNPQSYNRSTGLQLVNGSTTGYFFTITDFDNVTPQVQFVLPTPADGNLTAGNFTVNVTVVDDNLDKIIIYANGSAIQTCSSSPCELSVSTDGNFTFYAWVNDTVGHVNQTSNRTIVRDTSKPTIIVYSPGNNSVYTITVYLNYTVIDSTPNTTWYSLNGGANVNVTGNVTLPSVLGWNNLTVYANDSFGNLNDSGAIRFYFDNITPSIIVTSPVNFTYQDFSSPVYLNYSANDTYWNTIWYTLSNGTASSSNYSLANDTHSIQITAFAGTNTLVVSINDSAGNLNYSTVVFYADVALPQVFFNSTTPASNFYNSTVVVNASASDDTLLNYTWIQVNNSNVSFTACGTAFCNSTTAFGIEGVYNVTGWANDTTSKVNSTSTRSYTVDLTAPLVNITNPVNLTWFNTATATLTFTVIDANYNYSNYSFNGTDQGTAVNGTIMALNSDGYYSLVVTSLDKASNSNNSLAIIIWRDMTAPVITVASSTSVQGFRNTSANFNVTATDLNLSYVNITLNGSMVRNCNASAPSPCNYTINGDGVYYVNATAFDTTGHNSNTTTYYYVIDSVLPQLVVTSPVNVTPYAVAPALTFQVIDSYFNTSWFNLNGAFNYTNGNVTALSPLNQGWNNVTAYAIDSAFNQNNSQTFDFFFDNQPPQIDFINSNATGYYNSTQIVNFSTTDANISNVKIYVNGTLQTTCNGPATLLYCNVTLVAPSNYSVYANATDASGNYNFTATRNYTLDFTPPQIIVASPINTTSYNSTVYFNYSAVDAYLQSYWYILNGGAKIFAANVTLSPAQGWNNVTAYANDSAGNENNSGFITFFFDDQSPQINFAPSANASGYYNTSVKANFTATDANLSSIVIYVNGSSALYCNASPCNYTISADGNYSVYAWANDSTGLTNQTAVRNYVVDSATPLLWLYSPANNTFYTSASILLSYNASDAYLQNVWYSLDAGANVLLSGNTTLSGLSQATHSIILFANDSAGNSNSSGAVSFTVDSVKPTIVVLSPSNGFNYTNATLALNYYVFEANLNSTWFALNGVANKSAPGNVSITPVAGSNSLVVFANDSAGNENQSAQVLFYSDSQAPWYSSNSSSGAAHNQTVLLSTLWTDNLALAFAWLSTNNSGVWVNSTPVALIGTSYWSNVTLHLNATNGTLVQWMIYANDSVGNLNFTTVQNILTNNTAPVLTSNPSLSNYTPSVYDNVTCTSGTYFDADGDAQAASFTAWFMNGSLNTSGVQTINVSAFGAVVGDNFSCSIRVFDGLDNSTWYSSSNASVGATPDSTPPFYTTTAVSDTNHNMPASLSVLWSDNSGLGFLNGSIFSSNNSGVWVNYSFATFPGGSGWSNYTITLNNTNGAAVEWRIYAVDLNGNWNSTTIQTLTTTNTPPVLTTNPSITPAIAYRFDTLNCVSGTYFDANGDALSQSYWKWFKNGTAIAFYEETLSLEAAAAAVGDNFSCAQLVFDGFDNSTSWFNSTNRTVSSQIVPPVITSVAISGITSASATASWTTDMLANSVVYYSTNPAVLSTTAQNAANVSLHSVALSSLSASTVYYYLVSSCDRYGNCANSTSSSFTTTANASVIPVISGVGLTDLGTNVATIGWTTDIAATSLVEYGTTSSYGTNSTLNSVLVTTHSVFLTGLSGGMLYHYRVWSCVGANCAVSSDYTFSTSSDRGGGYGGGSGGYIPAGATPTVETATPTSSATPSATAEATVAPTSQAGIPEAPGAGGEGSSQAGGELGIVSSGGGPFQGGFENWLQRNAAAAGAMAAAVIVLLYFALNFPLGPKLLSLLKR